MINHSQAASIFNINEKRVDWHDQALWDVRQKRDEAAKSVKNWEILRSIAAQIKAHSLSNLSQYLEQFEQSVLNNGVHLHWAAEAIEHNNIVFDILSSHNAKRLVKSKSMLTEECGLNKFLEEKGIEVTDTDLGERIIQLANETPSHIVMPAIHKKREEIDELFHQHLGTARSDGDALHLTRKAREHLRQKFLLADAALTGVNFAVAETGELVICTNEGNADMGVHSAQVYIASMGIEKIIPKREHLGIFLRLLARSATGQPITTYSSHFRAPTPDKEMHIIIVDNGRSSLLSKPEFRSSLQCIRCGACMNTCPVYRRSGGHSYGYTIPGPIGSILAPAADLKNYSSLPFASTLCGSCSDICPVKIDIHNLLYKWRQVIEEKKQAHLLKKTITMITAFVFAHPIIYNYCGKMLRWFLRISPRFLIYNKLNIWGKGRELPKPASLSFTEWYKKNK
jgi:L-lactate dehydrogenase complex protein LldF